MMAGETGTNKPFPKWRIPVDVLVSLKPVAAFLRHVMYRLDAPLMRLSKGRVNLTMGLPSILLTTTGRKSGERRRSPLLYIKLGEDIAIVGTRFGSNEQPGWYYNLTAEPRATVVKDGETFEVEARPATAEERRTIWQEADKVYMGFPKYRERVTAREIPMFVLRRL
jgi:deazaflavin-dependent oxidoreductase (nitroreductase family)